MFCEEGIHKGVQVVFFPWVKLFELLEPFECIVVNVAVFPVLYQIVQGYAECIGYFGGGVDGWLDLVPPLPGLSLAKRNLDLKCRKFPTFI